eukprot:jgi/Chlat1/8035/Chrsp71S07512
MLDGLAAADGDAFAACLAPLRFRDVLAVAASCRSLRKAAASDASVRHAFIAKHASYQQLRLADPAVCQWHSWRYGRGPIGHVLLTRNGQLVATQGGEATVWEYGVSGNALEQWAIELDTGYGDLSELSAVASQERLVHGGKITCLRAFGSDDEQVLVTGSMDKTIRVWNKGKATRTLSGHTKAVTVIASQLLGEHVEDSSVGGNVLVSGGEDATVRLWDLRSGRGKVHALSVLRGHGDSITAVVAVKHAVASQFVSTSRDGKVKLWDTHGAQTGLASAKLPWPIVTATCKDHTVFAAGDKGLSLVDLRSMTVTSSAAVHAEPVLSMSVQSSSSCLLVTGSADRTARVWDMRMSTSGDKPHAVAIMAEHAGPVSSVHIDAYKVVTAMDKPCAKPLQVFTTSGENISRLGAFEVDGKEFRLPPPLSAGVGAIAVQGTLLASGTSGLRPAVICTRDYAQASIVIGEEGGATSAVSLNEVDGSRFWERQPAAPT